jgi:hypothetical protein
MSADNWAICPRCERQRMRSLEVEKAELHAAYGTVPVEEFDKRRAAYNQRLTARPTPTFHEDYEIYGAESGVLHIRYGGGCETCGLRHKFSDDQPIDVDGPPRG